MEELSSKVTNFNGQQLLTFRLVQEKHQLPIQLRTFPSSSGTSISSQPPSTKLVEKSPIKPGAVPSGRNSMLMRLALVLRLVLVSLLNAPSNTPPRIILKLQESSSLPPNTLPSTFNTSSGLPQQTLPALVGFFHLQQTLNIELVPMTPLRESSSTQ
jgi:hypothetical protein